MVHNCEFVVCTMEHISMEENRANQDDILENVELRKRLKEISFTVESVASDSLSQDLNLLNLNPSSLLPPPQPSTALFLLKVAAFR